MSFALHIRRQAQKELAKLPVSEQKRLVVEIRALAEDPRKPGCRKLVGREGWRVRSGNYRVIYNIDDAQQRVIVVHIGHRKDVYR